MKTKKNIFIISLFLLISSLNIHAQESAIEILEKVKKNSLSLNNEYYKFRIYSDNENSLFPMYGEFYIQDLKYFIDTNSIDQVYDGKKIYTIIHENEEIIVDRDNNTFLNFTPNQIFNYFSNGFDLSVKKEVNKFIISASNNLESNLAYNITINSNNLSIEEIIITDLINNKIVNSFLTITYEFNLSVPSSLFKFDINSYENYLIVEQN